MPTFYAHLPFLRLQTSGPVHLRALDVDVGIAPLPFAEWLGLDGDFARVRNLEPRYRASAPVFAVIENVTDIEHADDAVGCAHLALLLGTSSRLPMHQMSIRYLTPGKDGWQRRIGPLEREALLYHSDIVRCVVDDPTAARVEKMADLIDATGPVLEAPELGFGRRALERGALSEVTDLGDMALCMVAAEELLMGEVQSELTATFGRRAGVMFAPRAEIAGEGERYARSLYRLRSRFLHGDGGSASVDDATLIASARYLLVRSIVCVLAAASNGLLESGVTGFGALLDKAATTPSLRQRLHEAMPR